MDVLVDKMGGFYPPTYMVIVDGRIYDTFHCRDGKWITWAQMCDVADMYRQALDGYVHPSVES